MTLKEKFRKVHWNLKNQNILQKSKNLYYIILKYAKSSKVIKTIRYNFPKNVYKSIYKQI